MGNAQKFVIHIPKFRLGQNLFLFDINYYLKISLICSKFLILKKFCFGKPRNAKNLKIKFQQRRVKPNYSIDKRTIIL